MSTEDDVREIREELAYAMEREPWRGPEHVPALAALDRLEADLNDLRSGLDASEAALRTYRLAAGAEAQLADEFRERAVKAEAALRAHHANVWASCAVCDSTIGVQRDRGKA